jgi:hypothetical protein
MPPGKIVATTVAALRTSHRLAVASVHRVKTRWPWPRRKGVSMALNHDTDGDRNGPRTDEPLSNPPRGMSARDT